MKPCVQRSALFALGMMLLAIQLCRTSVGYAQSIDSDESTKEHSTAAFDPAALDGEWYELSFEISGEPGTEWERDHRTRTFVPVDILWRLSSESEPSFTRRVLRGDSENNDGDFNLGKHKVDTSVTPHRISFLGCHLVNSDVRIDGIFKMQDHLLVIALPARKYDPKTNTYDVSQMPRSFDTQGDSTGITVYTLRREPQR